ncbi:hypothetical protein ACTG9Q_13170 [Actinokineospora sp. 24-640]
MRPVPRPVRLLPLVPLFAALCATGCGPETVACPTENPPTGLTIAAAVRANSAKPAWPAELDAELARVTDAVENGATGTGVTMIRADGAPTIGCAHTYVPSEGTDPSKEYYRDQFKKVVKAEATRMAAIAPEANPLAALGQAAAAAGPDGTVVLIDSGLQTVAPLDFRTGNLLSANPDRVVAALKRGAHLPDLGGRKVILVGIGYTAAPQTPLRDGQRGHLIELWRKIAAAAGAREVVPVTRPNTTAPDGDHPPVSEVLVPPAEDIVLDCGLDVVLPDSGAVGFHPEETAFRNEIAARTVLTGIAVWLRDNPTATGAITGSVAHYGADTTQGLSLDRANRVRSVLVELGARAGQLTAKGMGWGPFPTKTAVPDPTSDPLNRRVVITLNCA